MTAGLDTGSAAPGLDEQVVVATAADMRTLGKRLARLLRAADVVVLSGPLGAGKTTLAQGIGSGLDVRGQITSPTFVIARLHPSLSGGPDLVHADAYRLGSRAEVDDLDLDTDLASSVTLVEWGEGLVEDLAPSFLAVGISVHDAVTATDATTATDAVTATDVGAESAAQIAELDVPRTVRVRGWGGRWHEPASVDAIRAALSGGPVGDTEEP